MMLYYKYSVLICTVVLYVATLALAADNLADCGSGDFKVNSIWSNGAKGKIYFNHSRFTMTWSVNVNFTSPIDPTKFIVPNGDKVKCASPTSCSFTVSSWNPLVIVGTKLTIDYEISFNGTTTPTIAALGLNGVRMCGGPPVNGNWGSWTDSTSCSKTCGGGTMTQTRVCNHPTPAYGGYSCPGSSSQTVNCNINPCPVNGNWGAWTESSSCTVTCGGGTKTLVRVCNNPEPANGGRTCPGSSTDTVACNTDPCPVNGGWGGWSDSSECSVSCGDGIKSQGRECNNPAPAYGGSPCSESATQEVPCNLGPCPVNGGWGPWSDSNECTVSCGDGTKSQTRECNNPVPEFGGNPCLDSATQEVPCNLGPCPVNGGWGPWSDSSECSLSCGDGTKSQTRECNNPVPEFGGSPCSDSATQDVPCNLGPCPVFSKVLVALGYNSGGSADVEIIDLLSSETTCKKPQNFPYGNRDPSGGLGFKDKPLICGGENNRSLCHLYEDGTWKSSESLKQGRRFFAMTKSPFQDGISKLFLTGGRDESNQNLNSSEVLTKNGWQVSVPLPVTIHCHCMVTVNSTAVMVIGGFQNGQTSGKSFIFNSETNIWTEGPTLKKARGYHSCGLIRRDSQTQDKSLIAVGGHDGSSYLRSVEVLDLDSTAWRSGPDLTLAICCAAMVEDLSGGVVLIGGWGGVYLDTLYRLRHAGSDGTWELMPQKLKTKRDHHTAFFIPDDITACN